MTEELGARSTTIPRYFNMTKLELVSNALQYLEALDFVQWDRWIDAYDQGKVIIFYGWINRKHDQYKDFVHLEFFDAGEGYQVAYTTSSSEKTDEIGKALGMEDSHQECKRVEKLFPKLKNAIKLAKIYKPN